VSERAREEKTRFQYFAQFVRLNSMYISIFLFFLSPWTRMYISIYTYWIYMCVYMRCIITQKKKKRKTQTQSIDDEFSILLWEQDSNSVHFEVFARLRDTQLNRSRLLFYIIFWCCGVKTRWKYFYSFFY
jgi:hypothetical protein